MEVAVQTQEVQLQEHFAPFERQAQSWMKKAKNIVVTDASQTELMASAREARLALRGIRISVSKKHEELKSDALKYSQALDRIKRTLVGLIEPIEAHLEEQEKFKEVQEEKARKELVSKRATALSQYMTFEEAVKFPLADMSDDAFSNLLNGYALARENAKKEQERLAAEAEEKRKADEADRKRLEEENQKQKAELEKKNQQLENERAEKRRLEQEAEEKRQKEEQAKKDEINRKRREARAPDKEKILSFCDKLVEIANSLPKMSTDEGNLIMADAQTMLVKMQGHLFKKANQL